MTFDIFVERFKIIFIRVAYIYSEKMLDAQDITDEKSLRETKLHMKLTNKGVYSGWSNERLFSLLQDKLVQYNNIKSLSACTDMQCDTSRNKLLYFTVHSGLYNEFILLELEGKGIKTFSYGNFCTHAFCYLSFFSHKIVNFRYVATKYRESNEIWSPLSHFRGIEIFPQLWGRNKRKYKDEET